MTDLIYDPPDTINEFIKDYMAGELCYDWIVGPVGCLPADSEFLTPTGWKRMDAYNLGDQVAVWADGASHYEPAEYVKLPTCEPFHVFDSGSLCMELSSEHTVIYEDYRGRRQTCTAARMAQNPSRRTIPTTFSVPDCGGVGWLTEADIRLRVAVSADGHVPRVGQQVLVTMRKERKKVRLRELLTLAGIEWTERSYPNRPTEVIFSFKWWLDKSLDFVWGLNTEQLEWVVDECTRWDGLNEHAEKRFYTTVKAHADAIQYAAHTTGRRATIHTVNDPRSETWSTMYTVAIRTGDNPKNRAMVRAETRIGLRDAPDGYKYCFHTSTGFFIARCRDTVFITGNSGKTTGIFMKLIRMAKLQAPGPDGIRRTRAVIVRNTLPQLRDTTLSSWNYWFKDGQAGKWEASNWKFILHFDDVECEVLFRPLDTAQDVARVLSLEVTFAIVDEFVEIPRQIIDALSARCGRYPSSIMGGATNWGMWGSSNPSTEDNWWYDYLHDKMVNIQPGETNRGERNSRYFLQPSGFSAEAENVENLPGGTAYYTNQAKGKSEAWIKQFLCAEWGYSVAGKAVVPTFKPELHLSKKRLEYNPHLPLIGGFDPGLRNSALIFGQEDLDGRLMVLGEIIAQGYGAERFISEKLKPYLRNNFPDAEFTIAPDPAAASKTPTDERTVVSVFKKHWPCSYETNNRLPLRLDAMEHFTTRLIEGKPALMVDEQMCPVLTRALKGGWRYKLDKNENIQNGEPDKNQYSHPGDAFGYLCRYYHRQAGRNERYVAAGVKPFVPPKTFGGKAYHVR